VVRGAPALLATALAALAAVELVAPALPSAPIGVRLAWLGLVSFPLAALGAYATTRLTSRVAALALVAAGGVGAAVLLTAVGLEPTGATLAKLVGAAALGAILGRLIQAPVDVVAIGALAAAVDAYSVFAGPTGEIVDEHPGVLNAFTLAFHPVGSDGVVQLGASDIVFMALFGVAGRLLGLRERAGWIAMALSIGASTVLSYAFDRAVPALPLLAAAFVAVNADLLVGRIRHHPSR
jgi:hypothetical protein